MSKRIGVAIVEDHTLFRETFLKTIKADKTWKDIDLVYEAGSGSEMIEKLRNCKPDVILMDLKMPDMDGIQATTFVNENYPGIKLIILSMYEERKFVIELVKCGAHGYLTKNTKIGVIHDAIHAVMENEFYFNDMLTAKAIGNWSYKTQITPSLDDVVQLTKREREVLTLICEGYKTSEIASILNIGDRTVEGHRSELLSKTEVPNTASLVKYAMENDLVAFDLRKRQNT